MNILLTSAGRRSYIVDYFKGCEGIDKVYASNSTYTIALQCADGYFISPLIYDERYIPSLIEYCRNNKISAVLSLFDIDLLVLARNEQHFRNANIELILAPAEFVEICNDKWKTYQFLIRHGLLAPRTYLSIVDVQRALQKGEISYPIIIKPRWGMASIGIYKVENEEELVVLAQKCEREIFSSYLNYESQMTRDEAVLFQEMIVGDEYGLDVLNNLNGQYIDVFAKQKISMRSGETDLGKTVNAMPFKESVQIISRYSRHHGLLSVDCIMRDEKIYFIEFNCRISGHYPLSYLAGFNYPQIIVDWMNKKELNRENLQFKENLYIIKDLVPTILHC